MAKKKVLNELPAEMIEEILLNLPVKSLLRFSSVSKTWKLVISQSWFVRRYQYYRSRAGRDTYKIVLGSALSVFSKVSLTYNVSSILTMASSVVEGTCTKVVVPQVGQPLGSVVSQLGCFKSPLASCGGLWLVCLSDWKSLILWNPSTRTHKKLPSSSIMPCDADVNHLVSMETHFVTGLGYDSVGDDYKIFKIPAPGMLSDTLNRTELYSLRNGSWRDVPNFPGDIHLRRFYGGVFVNGNLHWLSSHPHCRIISFDLSTEKFGEVIYPPTQVVMGKIGTMVSVLRGMLCLSVNEDEKYVIWAMEDYGVARSWSVKFTINIRNLGLSIKRICPLHIYENGVILFESFGDGIGNRGSKVFIQQDEKTSPRQLTYGSSVFADIAIGIVYADSLVTPASFV